MKTACMACAGRGSRLEPKTDKDGNSIMLREKCLECKGSGKVQFPGGRIR